MIEIRMRGDGYYGAHFRPGLVIDRTVPLMRYALDALTTMSRFGAPLSRSGCRVSDKRGESRSWPEPSRPGDHGAIA